MLGGGELQSACKALAGQTNNILIKGAVQNVAQYLQASDYFVSCSKAEGLPMAVIEALACGLPCLLSDISPHAEIFKLSDSPGSLYRSEERRVGKDARRRRRQYW